MNGIPHLTPAQRVILNEVAEGYTNKAIAKRLNYAVQTIKSNLQVIYDLLCPDRDPGMCYPRVVVAIWWREVGRNAYENKAESDAPVLGPVSDIGTRHLHVMFGERRAG